MTNNENEFKCKKKLNKKNGIDIFIYKPFTIILPLIKHANFMLQMFVYMWQVTVPYRMFDS